MNALEVKIWKVKQDIKGCQAIVDCSRQPEIRAKYAARLIEAQGELKALELELSLNPPVVVPTPVKPTTKPKTTKK